MNYIDTSVLAYAFGDEHHLREPCRTLLAELGGESGFSTTVEVIQEFVHVRSRRDGRPLAVDTGRGLAMVLGPLVSTDDDDIARAFDLYLAHPRLGAFDAVLAAAAINRGAGVVTAHRGFHAVPGLVVHDPADPDFLARLGIG